MAIFAVFALCDYKREKRGRVTDSVIPLRGLPCLSYDCYFISRFFLANRDPYGKIEKFTFMGPVKFSIELGPVPLPLGEVARRSSFLDNLAGKLLSIAFSGLRLEAPRKSTGVDSLWLDSGRHLKCLMTTGYDVYIGSSSLA